MDDKIGDKFTIKETKTVKEFLSSKSVLTPGIAGAITMLITATLSSQFGAPAKWTCLAISGLLGLGIALKDAELSASLRVIFFVLNSLVIFSVAVGVNATGTAAAHPKPPVFESEASGSVPFLHDWL